MAEIQKIRVKVKPGQKKAQVTKNKDMFDNVVYDVYVKSIPKNGKANKEMLEVLGDYFDIPKSHIEIKSGHTSRNKIILIPKK